MIWYLALHGRLWPVHDVFPNGLTSVTGAGEPRVVLMWQMDRGLDQTPRRSPFCKAFAAGYLLAMATRQSGTRCTRVSVTSCRLLQQMQLVTGYGIQLRLSLTGRLGPAPPPLASGSPCN
jgi:hypothetical protein